MKKLTLLTAALVSTAAMASMPLTAEAAGPGMGYQTSSNRNVIVVGGNNSSCDIQSVIQNLKDCFPNLNIPGIPSPDKPDNSLPTPPDGQIPDVNLPDQKPDQNVPDNNKPDQNVPDTDQPGDSENLTFAEQVVKLVNEERAKQGLSALTIKEDVTSAALVRAKEIQSSFSHTRPDGSQFSTALTQQNVSFRGAGENIAWGQKTPEEVMKAWMNSDGHRANILNKNFTSIGVGYENNNGVGYWVQLFTY